MEARDDLERELDRALIEAECGRVIGRGIGLAYAYLELALTDVETVGRDCPGGRC